MDPAFDRQSVLAQVWAVKNSGFLFFLALVSSCQSADDDGGLVQGPARLSESGLYANWPSRTLAERVVSFAPRFSLWSDGAEKTRYIWLPTGKRIDATELEHWQFPIGTKIWKEFRVDGRLVETRLTMKVREPDDGGWWRMAYVWDEAETEAVAAPLGQEDAAGTTHNVPEQRDCARCHYRNEVPVIGVSMLQLGGPAGSAPIEKLMGADLLENLPAARPLPEPFVPGDSTTQAALGYLHANCGHCHNSRSVAAADVKIFFELHLDETSPEATSVYKSTVGQPIHHFPDVGVSLLIAPGDPENSLVHYRMARRDDGQMPPVATEFVDEKGLATIDAWIRSLPK